MLSLAAVLVGLAARPAAAAPPNDPRFASQWGLSDIKAPEAWAKGTGGGVKVAVVSTGIADHPDLDGKTDEGFDATATPPRPRVDGGGRGTHLAGIVAAATNNGVGIAGVAPDARLLPFKAYEADSPGDTDSYVRALLEVPKSGAKVALVDLPSGLSSQPTVQQAIKNLGDGGISVAVGSGGASLGELPVLTVAATNADGGQVGASGVGPRGVAAPGGNVVSTTVPSILASPDSYGEMSGTGQAAAHVAGALAILRGLGANAGQAADLLRSTARKNGTTAFGAGMIDVAAAVAAFRAPVATTTTKPPASTTTKVPNFPAGTIPKATVVPSGPGGPSLGGDFSEPGSGESAIVPPGAEDFFDSGETGGPNGPVSQGDDQPLGLLALGFGLLFGVGSGLSVTFRRLANAPL